MGLINLDDAQMYRRKHYPPQYFDRTAVLEVRTVRFQGRKQKTPSVFWAKY
jgi:hypothetical protein